MPFTSYVPSELYLCTCDGTAPSTCTSHMIMILIQCLCYALLMMPVVMKSSHVMHSFHAMRHPLVTCLCQIYSTTRHVLLACLCPPLPGITHMPLSHNIHHPVPYCTVLPYDACAIYAPYIPVCTQSYSLISCYSIALLSSQTCMCPALITRKCYIFSTCPCSALVTC